MNIIKVSIAASGYQTFTCCCCHRRVNQAHDTVYADLHGESFKDYYCQTCVNDPTMKPHEHQSAALHCA